MIRDLLGIYPINCNFCAVFPSRVTERLRHREIGVVQLDVLADQSNPHRLRAAFNTVKHSIPIGKIRLSVRQGKLPADNIRKTIFLEHDRRLI